MDYPHLKDLPLFSIYTSKIRVLIEDALVGIEAALNTGMRVIDVTEMCSNQVGCPSADKRFRLV